MDEKTEEKELEKQLEKQEEKSPEEKNYEEKYRRDPLGTIVWAVILIWAGAVFMVDNMGYLSIFQPVIDLLPSGGDLWTVVNVPFIQFTAIQLFLFGVAFILAIEIVVRLIVPEYRRPIFGSVVFLGVVLSLAYDNWDFFFPLLLIAFGISILLRRR
jgi:hypothetical protein